MTFNSKCRRLVPNFLHSAQANAISYLAKPDPGETTANERQTLNIKSLWVEHIVHPTPFLAELGPHIH
jgi:hypothetical protein